MTQEELVVMLKKEKCNELVFVGKCHDCKEEISVVAGIENKEMIVNNGAVYKVEGPSIREDNIFLKCPKCYEKDPSLRNWRKLEVFSRVCGYLRPVTQWNKGKTAERKIRIPFNANKAIREAGKETDK